jgi:hypothetical protein
LLGEWVEIFDEEEDEEGVFSLWDGNGGWN